MQQQPYAQGYTPQKVPQPQQQTIPDDYTARYSGRGEITVTPKHVYISRGRSSVTIPMGSVTAIHYTRNPGTWFVVFCCLTIIFIPLLWLAQGSLVIDYQGRGLFSERIPFNRFQQADIVEVEKRLNFYVHWWMNNSRRSN